MPYDLVIRNGTLVDGSGRQPYVGDVAVVDGHIGPMGEVDGIGRREIDAEGHAVTPGFIDGHTHMDAQVLWDPLGTCSCWHGVTTVVMGNCGFSLAPGRAESRGLVVRNLERAEDISAAAMDAGIKWCWESFPEYLDAVDRRPKGINYSAYVGHSALRTWAMGERAFDGEATDEDIAAMERHLRASLRAGAAGFSTSRSASHETSDDRPVASRLASWDEVRNLVTVLSQERRGIFELALERVARSQDTVGRGEFLDRLGDLAVATQVPTTFGVLGIADQPLLDLTDRTIAAGGMMFGQSHCRGVAGILSFQTTMPFDTLPDWRDIRSQPSQDQLRAMADPVVRERLVASADRSEYGRTVGAEARKPDYERLYIMDKATPPHSTVAQRAAEFGLHPVELIIDLALESGLRQFFIQPFTAEDPAAILPVLRHPHTVMTFSDAGAHVSQIVDSSIQTHLLAYWVRQRQAFTLPEAVRMLTAVPATAWGIYDRGLLREGLVADINVFNPELVAPAMPVVSHDLPAGARRIIQRSVGFRATVVAGEVVIEGGEHTGILPGRLLRDIARRA